MGVPSTVENLDISDTSFGEAPGVQAAGSEGACFSRFFSVEFKGLITFRGEIH